jgi:hypothetical protein
VRNSARSSPSSDQSNAAITINTGPMILAILPGSFTFINPWLNLSRGSFGYTQMITQ